MEKTKFDILFEEIKQNLINEKDSGGFIDDKSELKKLSKDDKIYLKKLVKLVKPFLDWLKSINCKITKKNDYYYIINPPADLKFDNCENLLDYIFLDDKFKKYYNKIDLYRLEEDVDNNDKAFRINLFESLPKNAEEIKKMLNSLKRELKEGWTNLKNRMLKPILMIMMKQKIQTKID